LAAAISRGLTLDRAVLDGEIVGLDRDEKVNFADLSYRRKACHFYAFDVLFANGEDLRQPPLIR